MIKKTVVIGLLEALVLYVIYLMYFFPLLKGAEDYVFIYPFNLKDGSIYWALNIAILTSGLLFFMNVYYAIPRFLKNRQVWHYVLFVFVLFASVIVFEKALEELLKLVYRLPENFKALYGTDYDNLPMRRNLDYSQLIRNVAFLALSFGFRYFKDWQQVLKDRAREQSLLAEKRKAELNYLISQVNPHFLFNSLNNIYAITERNNDIEASSAISKLSNMMRFMLYDSGTEFIELTKEISYIQDYIELQQLRFADDEVIVNLMVKGNVKQSNINPFILIPFVENAFKYGVAIHQTSVIKIEIQVTEDKLHFMIRNRILSTSNNHDYSGIGIKNVRERLELVYPGQHKLQITNDNDYFIVNLDIQFSP